MLAAYGIVASMSRTGDSYDNAVAESFFASSRPNTWTTSGTPRTRPPLRSSTEAGEDQWQACPGGEQ
jgi:transposase InsO family protein